MLARKSLLLAAKMGRGLLLLGLVACASSTITINSDPTKADIYIRKLSDSTSKKIGTTPLTIQSSDVSDAFGGSGTMFLELRKEGYLSSTVIVTDLNARDIEIKVKMEATNFLDMANSIDSVVTDLFECQKLIRKKELVRAREILNKIKVQFPYLSVIYEFEGGVDLIEQRYTQALDNFKMAIKYNSGNVEALRLKRAVEKQFNLTSEGGGGSGAGADTTGNTTNQNSNTGTTEGAPLEGEAPQQQ
ncbi:MAG: hypothetical protein A2504_09010 [Bdellovibrionales bacterium RIFOXYD12_FULL_39_22]|nr:MAG: hypothetical protein A2385_13525 [Bdellovibrionales bacterium RIFOXYB1_FULL_39_21]OFZ40891.1 MAG: hypothetical protein A2485_16220 [Bdellovibrionales bacterium RIFOXYC12_FULL_39_17]OFZ44765.1 MAG: hypothetical protein A2404_10900 [Bdellovibrionales bacterium RIFOXYC1_FULL_39_130]OFZ74217.1 MAG: hypothetical protein A2560_03565 [Bdellovibrionales bacterium RIFOXYD1_FULL_39_84]OFZ92097.1 MAG: hypothetical protein A2504_09010 [Bdellovibrionales bacterium RIFOXYD12_FULL_39_22]HLE10583.1 hy